MARVRLCLDELHGPGRVALAGEPLRAPRRGLLAGGRKNAYVPVLFTAATDCIGIHALLGSIKLLAPSPAESVSRTAIDKRSNETVELVTEDVRPNFHGLVIGPSEPCKLRYRRRAIVEARRAPAVSVPEALAPQAVGPQTVAAQPPLLRITLDRDLCQGHAVCIEEAPEVFTLADDGKVALLTDTPAPEHHAAVREAARYCPQKTILLHEAPAAAQASGCPFH